MLKAFEQLAKQTLSKNMEKFRYLIALFCIFLLFFCLCFIQIIPAHASPTVLEALPANSESLASTYLNDNNQTLLMVDIAFDDENITDVGYATLFESFNCTPDLSDIDSLATFITYNSNPEFYTEVLFPFLFTSPNVFNSLEITLWQDTTPINYCLNSPSFAFPITILLLPDGQQLTIPNDNIEYIYHYSNSTTTGSSTLTNGYYIVPFFLYLIPFTTFLFTLLLMCGIYWLITNKRK
jgi:hypothetical protein